MALPLSTIVIIISSCPNMLVFFLFVSFWYVFFFISVCSFLSSLSRCILTHLMVFLGVRFSFLCGRNICSSVVSLVFLVSLKQAFNFSNLQNDSNSSLSLCLLYTFRCGYKIRIFLIKAELLFLQMSFYWGL